MIVGSTIYITAKYTQRYRDSKYYDLRVSDVQYLQTVRDKGIQKFTIVVDSEAINEVVVNDITTMLADSKGNTQLYFQIVDKKRQSNILLHSKLKEISVHHNIIRYIEEHQDMSYVVN